MTKLIEAIDANSPKEVDAILKENKDEINLPDEAKNRPIVRAVEQSHEAVVEVLVRYGATKSAVNIKTSDCILATAIKKKSVGMVRTLADKVTANTPTWDGYYPLTLALTLGKDAKEDLVKVAEIVALLCLAGAAFERKDRRGNSVLQTDIFNLYKKTERKNPFILANVGKCFLDGFGVDRDIGTGIMNLKRAFYNAKEQNTRSFCFDTLNDFVDKKADVAILPLLEMANRALIEFSLILNQEQVAQKYIQKLNFRDNFPNLEMLESALTQLLSPQPNLAEIEKCRQVLTQSTLPGVKLWAEHLQVKAGNQAASNAEPHEKKFESKYDEVSQQGLSSAARIVNVPGDPKQRLLLQAIDNNQPHVIEEILKNNQEDVNEPDETGNRPIVRAVKQGKDDIIKVLVKYGAEKEAMDIFTGRYILHSAIEQGFIGGVVNLADKSTANTLALDGKSPLMLVLALLENSSINPEMAKKIIVALVNAGAEIDRRDRSDKLPFKSFLEKGYFELAIILLKLSHQHINDAAEKARFLQSLVEMLDPYFEKFNGEQSVEIGCFIHANLKREPPVKWFEKGALSKNPYGMINFGYYQLSIANKIKSGISNIRGGFYKVPPHIQAHCVSSLQKYIKDTADFLNQHLELLDEIYATLITFFLELYKNEEALEYANKLNLKNNFPNLQELISVLETLKSPAKTDYFKLGQQLLLLSKHKWLGVRRWVKKLLVYFCNKHPDMLIRAIVKKAAPNFIAVGGEEKSSQQQQQLPAEILQEIEDHYENIATLLCEQSENKDYFPIIDGLVELYKKYKTPQVINELQKLVSGDPLVSAKAKRILRIPEEKVAEQKHVNAVNAINEKCVVVLQELEKADVDYFLVIDTLADLMSESNQAKLELNKFTNDPDLLVQVKAKIMLHTPVDEEAPWVKTYRMLERAVHEPLWFVEPLINLETQPVGSQVIEEVKKFIARNSDPLIQMFINTVRFLNGRNVDVDKVLEGMESPHKFYFKGILALHPRSSDSVPHVIEAAYCFQQAGERGLLLAYLKLAECYRLFKQPHLDQKSLTILDALEKKLTSPKFPLELNYVRAKTAELRSAWENSLEPREQKYALAHGQFSTVVLDPEVLISSMENDDFLVSRGGSFFIDIEAALQAYQEVVEQKFSQENLLKLLDCVRHKLQKLKLFADEKNTIALDLKLDQYEVVALACSCSMTQLRTNMRVNKAENIMEFADNFLLKIANEAAAIRFTIAEAMEDENDTGKFKLLCNEVNERLSRGFNNSVCLDVYKTIALGEALISLCTSREMPRWQKLFVTNSRFYTRDDEVEFFVKAIHKKINAQRLTTMTSPFSRLLHDVIVDLPGDSCAVTPHPVESMNRRTSQAPRDLVKKYTHNGLVEEQRRLLVQ